MNNIPSKRLNLPLSTSDIASLNLGETILLSGVVVTGRDAAHKWLFNSFVHGTDSVTAEDRKIYEEILLLLNRGAIFHCGPIVTGLENQPYRVLSAGPTTSIREEPYQAEIIRHFNLSAVIGKGGMGEATLAACAEVCCVYLQAVGGAAVLAADCVTEVQTVYKLEFGMPEALWVLNLKDLPLTVTMDAHGNSLHKTIREDSKTKIDQLFTK